MALFGFKSDKTREEIYTKANIDEMIASLASGIHDLGVSLGNLVTTVNSKANSSAVIPKSDYRKFRYTFNNVASGATAQYSISAPSGVNFNDYTVIGVSWGTTTNRVNKIPRRVNGSYLYPDIDVYDGKLRVTVRNFSDSKTTMYVEVLLMKHTNISVG